MQRKNYHILLGQTYEWSLWRHGHFMKAVFKTGSTVNILQHIHFINDISDVLHPSSGYNSGLQNFNLKNICIINTPYGNKTIII